MNKYRIAGTQITITDDVGEKHKVTFYADGRVRVRYFEGTKMFLNDKHPWGNGEDGVSLNTIMPKIAVCWLQSKGLFKEEKDE
jgi:hypothetical protein